MSDLALDEFVLCVPGEAVPWSKGAPPGKGPQVPERQSGYAGKIRQCWREQHGDKGVWLEKGKPVRIVGEFWLQRPKGQYAAGLEGKEPKSTEYAKPAKLYPTGKPDLSNLLKMYEDALTHIVWDDDDQVVDLSGSKRLVHWWEPARSVVRITSLPFENLWDWEQYKRQVALAEMER